MSKAASTFRKTDIKRSIEAVEMAGLKVGRVEIDKTGKIILFPVHGEQAAVEPQEEIKL